MIEVKKSNLKLRENIENLYDYCFNLDVSYSATLGGHHTSNQILQEYIDDIGGREIGWFEDITSSEKCILNEMFLVYAFSIFEAYIKDLLLITFQNKNDLIKIKQKKTMTYKEILDISDFNELLLYMSNEIINELRMKLLDLDTFFEKTFKISLQNDIANLNQADKYQTNDLNYIYDFKAFKGKNCWESLIEFQERRNIIVHNNGKIDKKYNEINNSNFKIGKRIKTTEQDIYYLYSIISLFIHELNCEFITKFCD